MNEDERYASMLVDNVIQQIKESSSSPVEGRLIDDAIHRLRKMRLRSVDDTNDER